MTLESSVLMHWHSWGSRCTDFKRIKLLKRFVFPDALFALCCFCLPACLLISSFTFSSADLAAIETGISHALKQHSGFVGRVLLRILVQHEMETIRAGVQTKNQILEFYVFFRCSIGEQQRISNLSGQIQKSVGFWICPGVVSQLLPFWSKGAVIQCEMSELLTLFLRLSPLDACICHSFYYPISMPGVKNVDWLMNWKVCSRFATVGHYIPLNWTGRTCVTVPGIREPGPVPGATQGC